MNKNANIFDKIMLFASHRGIKNASEFASILGYSSPEKLYRLKRKPDAKPSYEILQDIANKFEDFDFHWLLNNDSPLDGYKSADTLSPNINEPPPNYTDKIIPSVVTVDKHNEDNVVMVPIKARAGYLLGFEDPEFISELPSYSFPGIRNGTFRAFEVEGHSMSPTLMSGDFAICEWVEGFGQITDDRVYVIVTKNDGILIKRVINRIEKYEFLLAKSDATVNREMYPSIKIPPSEIAEIWYVRSYMSANLSSPSDIYTRINELEAQVEFLKGKLPS
ncbi:MAG: S24/S26 family peptidase [Cyclobacteriaceae bacterium]